MSYTGLPVFYGLDGMDLLTCSAVAVAVIALWYLITDRDR